MNQLDVIGSYQSGFGNALAGGQKMQQMTAQREEMQRQEEIRNWLSDNAGALMQGDPQAMAGYAQYDPQGAFTMQRQTRADSRATEMHSLNVENIRQQMAMRTAEEARKLTAAEREAEASQAAAALSSATAAFEQGPEAMAAWTQQNAAMLAEAGIDPAEVTSETFPMIVAGVQGAVDGLSAGIETARSFGDPEMSAADEKVARLMETGIDRDTAIGIVDGRLKVSRDPLNETVEIIDVATGQPWTGGDAPQRQPQEQPAPNQLQGGQEFSFGEQFESAERAGGFGGTARGVVNTVADTFGRELPYPQTEAAQADFANFGEGIVNAFASAYGRQPPSWLLQNIAALAPQPGLFEGSGRMQSKLRGMGRELQARREALSAELGRDMDPNERSDVQGQILGIDAAVRQINQALEGFGPDDAPQQPRENGGQEGGGAKRLRFNPETGQLEPVQ